MMVHLLLVYSSLVSCNAKRDRWNIDRRAGHISVLSGNHEHM